MAVIFNFTYTAKSKVFCDHTTVLVVVETSRIDSQC